MNTIKDAVRMALKGKKLPCSIAYMEIESTGAELGYLSRDEVLAASMLAEDLNMIYEFSSMSESNQRHLMYNLICLGAQSDVEAEFIQTTHTAETHISFMPVSTQDDSVGFTFVVSALKSDPEGEPRLHGYIASPTMCEEILNFIWSLENYQRTLAASN